ncbi:MAG: DUF4012 domain-containing protein [Actinomycetota bacterium]|nr:DUF4012 domain-containing protein [Actinomycetota bacterium]
MDEPWIEPLQVVPYFGRQLRSAQALSGAAQTVAVAGRQTLGQAHDLLNAPHATPIQRASVVRRLATTVSTLAQRTAHVDLGPSQALLPMLASKRATLANDLAKLHSGLDRGRGATAALADLLTGPRTYLVLAANNAEMRDGSGMFLEAGTMTADNGSLTFGPFVPTADLYNPNPSAPLTGDLRRLWGQFQPNQEWRSLGLSPQFPANAALAAQMWQDQMNQKVDGVLVVDVEGLKAILGATGPVSGGGQTANADDVEQILLKDQYAGLSAEGNLDDVRHEELGALAASVLGAVQQGSVSLASLGSNLTGAAGGRHLLAWAANPAIEADWTAAGIGGEVDRSGLLLGLLNTGANKLDPYQQITTALTLANEGANTKITIAATIVNNTPSGLSPYVAAGDGQSLPSGTYVGVAALDFPKAAGYATVDRPAVSAEGSDYTSAVLAVPVIVPAGQSTTIRWSFLLAGHRGRVVVDPSARIPATRWRTQDQTFSDALSRAVTW